MAEWQHGAAQGAKDVVYITVSTGIGGGIVVNGQPLIGMDGTAGEVGHLTVELDGPLCGDGMPGHAEAFGSGTAIEREGRALLERGESPALARLAASPADVPAEMGHETRGGDPRPRTWREPGGDRSQCSRTGDPSIPSDPGREHRPEGRTIGPSARHPAACIPVPARRVRV